MHGCWRAKMYVLTILQKVCNQSGHSFDVLLKHVSRMKLILILFGTGNIQRRSSHIYGFIKEIILVLVWRFLSIWVAYSSVSSVVFVRPSVGPSIWQAVCMSALDDKTFSNGQYVQTFSSKPFYTRHASRHHWSQLLYTTFSGLYLGWESQCQRCENNSSWTSWCNPTGWFTEAYTFLFCKIDLQENLTEMI